jgi:hypothetical protein
MTSKRPDAEQVIRDWLADSAPDRAPASLREALEDATSGPPGSTRPWPSARFHGLRLAGRIAAAVAILAVAGSGIYIYGTNRPPSPVSSASGSAAPTAPATSTASPSSSTPSPQPQPTVVRLPGSSWSLVSKTFPQMVGPDVHSLGSTVFALATGGFVAFVPAASGQTSALRSGDAIPMAFPTASPTSAPRNLWETRVFQSGDGVNWSELPILPSNAATVSSLTESGGLIVAVGWTGVFPNNTPMAWTTTDLMTWHATELVGPPQTEASGVAHGPDGFLAWGVGPTSTVFWISSDGVVWGSLGTSGLPALSAPDELFSLPGGFGITQGTDRAQVWQSKDGYRWTLAWQGPAPFSSVGGYFMGPIVKAPDGTYISFGAVSEGGGPLAVPNDVQIWTSPDLLHWTKSDRVQRPGWMYDFAAGPGGFVAAGQTLAADPAGTPFGPLGVWSSSDGRTWNPLAGIPSVGQVEVLSVVGDGSHVVVAFVDEAGNLQLLVGTD